MDISIHCNDVMCAFKMRPICTTGSLEFCNLLTSFRCSITSLKSSDIWRSWVSKFSANEYVCAFSKSLCGILSTSFFNGAINSSSSVCCVSINFNSSSRHFCSLFTFSTALLKSTIYLNQMQKIKSISICVSHMKKMLVTNISVDFAVIEYLLHTKKAGQSVTNFCFSQKKIIENRNNIVPKL